MDTPCYEEFYISCNPPLLPAGVAEVVEQTKAALEVRFPHISLR